MAAPSSDRQAGDNIEVTAAMKDAGMNAYEEWRAEGGEEDGTTGRLAVAIYLAMKMAAGPF